MAEGSLGNARKRKKNAKKRDENYDTVRDALGGDKTKRLNVRVPTDLYRRFKIRCIENGEDNMSDVIKAFMREYVSE